MKLSDWQALQRLLSEKRDALIPDPPKPTRREPARSEAHINAYSAWMEEFDQITDLLDKFQEWEPNAAREAHERSAAK